MPAESGPLMGSKPAGRALLSYARSPARPAHVDNLGTNSITLQAFELEEQRELCRRREARHPDPDSPLRTVVRT